MNDNKLISIITVVYNSDSLIRKTIESVVCQSNYAQIEYIVIDGNSKDQTINIINEYSSFIDVLISENDLGIYDAMNKGLKYVNGEWVLFLNAGDELVNSSVINNFSEVIKDNDEILYGNIIVKNNFNSIKISPSNLYCINFKMPFCHQAAFVRKPLLKNNLFAFELNYRVASDYNQFYKFYKENKTFRYIDLDIAKYDLSGQTYKNPLLYQKEVISIIIQQNNYFNKYFFLIMLFIFNSKSFIKIMIDKVKHNKNNNL